MKTREIASELNAAIDALDEGQRNLLVAHGVGRNDLALGLVGAALIRVEGTTRFAPDPEGRPAFITPVRVQYAETPESVAPDSAVRVGDIVDLVAWHPLRPDRWALRSGAAEWLGCIEPQYAGPHPVPIRRSVLGWFRAGCVGLLPLSQSPADLYRLLTWCVGGVIAEDAEHAAKLRRALERPWPAPRVLVRHQEHRHAA